MTDQLHIVLAGELKAEQQIDQVLELDCTDLVVALGPIAGCTAD